MKLRKIFAAVVCCSFLQVQRWHSRCQLFRVKIGRLDNGLTYYIRHNSYPETWPVLHRSEKWVLSMRMMTSAVWLTLEHLAFNGTDHFKGNSLGYPEHRCTVWPVISTPIQQ